MDSAVVCRAGSGKKELVCDTDVSRVGAEMLLSGGGRIWNDGLGRGVWIQCGFREVGSSDDRSSPAISLLYRTASGRVSPFARLDLLAGWEVDLPELETLLAAWVFPWAHMRQKTRGLLCKIRCEVSFGAEDTRKQEVRGPSRQSRGGTSGHARSDEIGERESGRQSGRVAADAPEGSRRGSDEKGGSPN